MSCYALGTEIEELGEASCQAGWWRQASWCVVFKDSCSYRSWSNFMFCGWGLLIDVTCMFIGGGTANVTPREVCETGDRLTKGNPLLWPSWNREDPISMCCCQSNKCLLYSCHWQWGCLEVCWRRGSYGSWAVPGNVMLLSGWTSGGWADPLCSTFKFQVHAGNLSCCSMFGTTWDSCVNLLSYKSVNFLILCSIVLQSIYNLSLGPDGLI